MVAFTAGGTTDVIARSVGQLLSEQFKQPFVVENKPGSGGNIGNEMVARSPADGYTITVASVGPIAVNPTMFKDLKYDPLTDLTPVILIADVPNVLVINPKTPVKNFAEFVAYLKANPDKLSYASPGNGTIGHMWGEMFKNATGTAMTHVPYKGAGPALNDVLGGQVPVYFDQVAPSVPHIQSGKLRALAVSWDKRLEVLPDVPTYAELGFASLNDPSWFGLVAPAGTPPQAINRVRDAAVAALKDPAVTERLAALGLYVSGTTPEAFGQEIAHEIEKMRTIGEKAGIKAD